MSDYLLTSVRVPADAAPARRHSLFQKARLVPEYLRTAQGTPWDRAPRPWELADLREYRRAVALHKRLLDQEYTMLSSRRGRALHRFARELDRQGVPGALVDCGVWNGGSTILLADGAPLRDVWAFDSFEGLPEPLERDGANAEAWVGRCLGAEERLRDGFARYANPQRLHVVKGWFEDTFPSAVPEIGPIALLHCDGDWYESVLLTLGSFYDQVQPGGWVVIDDYGFWPGAQQATDEFRARRRIAAPLERIDHSGRYWRVP